MKSLTLALLVLFMTGCGAPNVRPTDRAVENEGRSSGSAALPPPGTYRLDSQNSELRVLVFKAGPLSSLGHNHVVVNRSLAGTVFVADTLAKSFFDFRIPVGAFVVDDATARQEEGVDFASEVSEEAKAGTLHNMLGSAVLDAADYPDITLHGVGGVDASGAAIISLNVDVAGHRSSRTIPLSWQPGEHGFTAIGSVEIAQSSLGLTPYSLMLGALQVRDTLQIKFKILALP